MKGVRARHGVLAAAFAVAAVALAVWAHGYQRTASIREGSTSASYCTVPGQPFVHVDCAEPGAITHGGSLSYEVTYHPSWCDPVAAACAAAAALAFLVAARVVLHRA